MIMKIILSMFLAFATLIGATNALALNQSSDALFDQIQSHYCAESDSDKNKKKKAESGEEEEPDCD